MLNLKKNPTSHFKMGAAILATLLIGLEITHAQQFRSIGNLPEGFTSEAWGVSADGSVVVGIAEDENFTRRAVRWTAANGLEALLLPGSPESEGQAVSANGSVFAGGFRDPSGNQLGFRFAGNTLNNVGTLVSPGISFARGISGDGNVIVGWSADAQGQEQPFRWSASTGIQNLGTFGGRRGFAFDANADGSVVVGSARDESETLQAFRWTAEGGKEKLLPSLESATEATAITPDGRYIAVNASPSAFRWSASGPLLQLPAPAGLDFVSVNDISADGQKMVGRSQDEDFQSIAIMWTAEAGTVDLNKAFDGAIPRNWILTEATAISEDGRWIVGLAENPFGSKEGFLLEVKEVAPPKPEIKFVNASSMAFENSRDIVIPVSHNGPTSSPVTISFRTVAGSAVAGKDFVSTEGVLTFATGSNQGQIRVPLLNDSEIDPDKTFTVVLSNPSEGFDLFESETLVTISDNEAGYEIPSLLFFSESQLFTDLKIFRIGDFQMESSLELVTLGQNAVAGLDYVPATNVVHFAAGQTQAVVRIHFGNDSVIDGSKFLSVYATNATGGLPLPSNMTQIEIEDNELGYTLGDKAVIQENPASTLNLYRLGDFNQSTSVRVSLSDRCEMLEGSATMGEDYSAFTTNVTFAPGSTNMVIPVPVFDDHQMEHGETLFVTVTSLSDEVPAPEFPVQVTIVDNDVNPAEVEDFIFTGNVNEITQALPLPNGKIIVRGQLQVSIDEFQEFHQVLRLNADGSVDSSFAPYTTVGSLGPIALQSDGSLLVMENPDFSFRKLIRLRPTGAVDSSFGSTETLQLHPSSSMAVQKDDKIVIVAAANVKRLHSNGTLDTTFASPIVGGEDGVGIFFPVISPEGALFLQGSFGKVNNVNRPGIARLLENGDIDPAFAPTGNHLIFVGFGSNGQLYAYQDSKLLQLLPNGQPAPGFTPVEGIDFRISQNGSIYSITQEEGSFTLGQRLWIRRHLSNGEVDETFTPTSIITDRLNSTLIERAPGRFLLAGDFATVNGQLRMALASLRVDGKTPKILPREAIWETNGSVQVPVIRTGNNEQPLTATITWKDNSAKEGIHYVAKPVTVTFAPGVSDASVELELIDNQKVQQDTMVNLVAESSTGVKLNETPLTIQNNDPGFLVSELYLASGKTVAMRFSGVGQPILQKSSQLESWKMYGNMTNKREILVPDTSASQMEFYQFIAD